MISYLRSRPIVFGFVLWVLAIVALGFALVGKISHGPAGLLIVGLIAASIPFAKWQGRLDWAEGKKDQKEAEQVMAMVDEVFDEYWRDDDRKAAARVIQKHQKAAAIRVNAGKIAADAIEAARRKSQQPTGDAARPPESGRQ